MKKKIGALFLALVMAFCVLPATVQKAEAGMYTIDLRCNPNASDAKVGSSGLGQTVYRSVRRDSNLTNDFNNIKATRSGWTFLGWYSAASAGTKITASNVKNYDGATIYAHWAKFTVTTSGNGWVSALGGTVSATINSNGHTWRVVQVDDLSGHGTSWLSRSVSGGYVTATATRNNGSLKRRARIWLTDQWNNVSFSFVVTQQSFTEIIDGKFVTNDEVFGDINKKFLNIVGAGGRTNYDMHYAGWFYNNGGCCTDSAMMDLLNRRLARDGKLNASYFFDIRDVVRGMAVNDLGSAGYSGMSVETRYGGDNYPQYWSPNLVNVPSGRGGERVNDPASYSSASFANVFGNRTGAGCTTYNVTLEAGGSEARVRELLRNHPEGVFVYAAKSGGGQHAFVVTMNGDGTILYLDNGNSAVAGPTTRNTINGYSPAKNVFSHIICLGYIQ